MLRGFMDHIVSTKNSISSFYKIDFSEAKKIFSELIDEMDFNNFTFYTKWYTNGIKSSLSFLENDIHATNIRTNNKFFCEIIDYLHQNGLTVGAMLQIYTYTPASLWGDEALWGKRELSAVLPREMMTAIADPTSETFRERLRAMIDEYGELFPELDYIFIEGEMVYEPKYWRPEVFGDKSEKNYTPDILEFCKRAKIEPNICWSKEAIEIAHDFTKTNLCIVEDTLRKKSFRGRKGFVYYLQSPERKFAHLSIPNKDWYLIPWSYFGWEKGPDNEDSCMHLRIEESKDYMKKIKDEGYKIIYMGDVTITPKELDALEEMWDFVSKEKLDGYLGMGNPIPKVGLRWMGITDEMVNRVRKLYRETIWPKRGKRWERGNWIA